MRKKNAAIIPTLIFLNNFWRFSQWGKMWGIAEKGARSQFRFSHFSLGSFSSTHARRNLFGCIPVLNVYPLHHAFFSSSSPRVISWIQMNRITNDISPLGVYERDTRYNAHKGKNNSDITKSTVISLNPTYIYIFIYIQLQRSVQRDVKAFIIPILLVNLIWKINFNPPTFILSLVQHHE